MLVYQAGYFGVLPGEAAKRADYLLEPLMADPRFENIEELVGEVPPFEIG